MKATLNNLVGVKGLSAMTMGELCQTLPLHEAVLKKCELLDHTQFRDQHLEKTVRLMVEIVRATMSGSYTKVSVLAFAHILSALDYFLLLHDRVPDTQVRGFVDDCEELTRVFHRYKTEIDEFKKWKLRSLKNG